MACTRNLASRPVLCMVITMTLAAVACSEAQASAGDATIYKIRNRWLSDQYLNDSTGTVAYGAGDDATYRWTLEDAGGLLRIRNVGTGASMVLVPGATRVATVTTVPAGAVGQWEFVHVGGPAPPKFFRRGPVAVIEPGYGSTVTGGWPVDLSRYDGVADMYVDWVWVYQE